MSSSVVAYGEIPPPREAGDIEPAGQVEPARDRGKDWPLALIVFIPVLAAYAGAGYCAYAVVRALL